MHRHAAEVRLRIRPRQRGAQVHARGQHLERVVRLQGTETRLCYEFTVSLQACRLTRAANDLRRPSCRLTKGWNIRRLHVNANKTVG
jgi:hypothetical protein